MRTRLLSLLSVAALVSMAASQTVVPPTSPAGRIYERDLHERWITPGRRSTSDHDVGSLIEIVYIDSVRDANGARTVFLSQIPEYADRGNNPIIQATGQFTRDASGRITAVSGQLRDRPLFGMLGGPAERAAATRRNLFEDIETTHLALPDARIWEFATSFRNDRAFRGSRWIDTLAFEQVLPDGYRQALRGAATRRA